jgi:hypothetical protein
MNEKIKKTITDRLIYLEKQSQQYYDQDGQMNLIKLAENLIIIQKMSENMDLFED